MKRPEAPIVDWSHDRAFRSVKREVESMSDAKLSLMLFHTIWESARRRDRDSVIKQLRGQADHLERGLVH